MPYVPPPWAAFVLCVFQCVRGTPAPFWLLGLRDARAPPRYSALHFGFGPVPGSPRGPASTPSAWVPRLGLTKGTHNNRPKKYAQGKPTFWRLIIAIAVHFRTPPRNWQLFATVNISTVRALSRAVILASDVNGPGAGPFGTTLEINARSVSAIYLRPSSAVGALCVHSDPPFLASEARLSFAGLLVLQFRHADARMKNRASQCIL